MTQPPQSLVVEERDLRSRILAVATHLFATRGFAGTSMREVAAAASCTKPALYYHFQGKASLFLEIIREKNRLVRALIEQQLVATGSVRERMRSATDAYLDHVRADPDALAVQLRAELQPEPGQPEFDFRSARQLVFDQVMRLLRQGVERGEIRADVNLEDALYAIGGMVDMRCMLWLLDRQPIPDDYPERILALLFRGLSP